MKLNVIKKWKNLSASERFRLQAIFICFVVIIYGAVFYPVSKRKLTESENMLHRRQDRIKKRAADTVGAGGASAPQSIARKIEQIDEELNTIRAEFDELDSGFAPLDSTEIRQRLLLEMSTLAERAGVELLSVASKGFSPDKDPGRTVVDPTLGRPLLEVTATTDFPRLLTFLYGLRDLSFYVSVTKLKIKSRQLDKEQGKDARYLPSGAISVVMEMSI